MKNPAASSSGAGGSHRQGGDSGKLSAWRRDLSMHESRFGMDEPF